MGLKGSFLAEFKASVATLFSGRIQASVDTSLRETEKQVRIANQVIGCNLVSKFLEPSGKRVVLEDFHYANDQLKVDLAQDLKAFSDDGCQFILISVQHRNTDLIIYNPDLQQRIASLSVGMFSSEGLKELIQTGAKLLKIEFSEQIVKKIIDESMLSAALTQDICQKICFDLDIMSTRRERLTITDPSLVDSACQFIAGEHRPFYETLVKFVAAGGRSDGSTEKYKWILKMIQVTEIPNSGLLNTEVYQRLRTLGHTSIDQGSVTGGLKYLPKLLQNRSLPPVFDYIEDNNDKRFFLLDRYMKFVFKWIPSLIDDLFASER